MPWMRFGVVGPARGPGPLMVFMPSPPGARHHSNEPEPPGRPPPVSAVRRPRSAMESHAFPPRSTKSSMRAGAAEPPPSRWGRAGERRATAQIGQTFTTALAISMYTGIPIVTL